MHTEYYPDIAGNNNKTFFISPLKVGWGGLAGRVDWLWVEVHPDIADPVPHESDKICNRSKRTEVAAPRSTDEESGDEHYSQQHKMKVGPDQVEKGAEDFVTGDARVAVEKSDRDGAKG